MGISFPTRNIQYNIPTNCKYVDFCTQQHGILLCDYHLPLDKCNFKWLHDKAYTNILKLHCKNKNKISLVFCNISHVDGSDKYAPNFQDFTNE